MNIDSICFRISSNTSLVQVSHWNFSLGFEVESLEVFFFEFFRVEVEFSYGESELFSGFGNKVFYGRLFEFFMNVFFFFLVFFKRVSFFKALFIYNNSPKSKSFITFNRELLGWIWHNIFRYFFIIILKFLYFIIRNHSH